MSPADTTIDSSCCCLCTTITSYANCFSSLLPPFLSLRSSHNPTWFPKMDGVTQRCYNLCIGKLCWVLHCVLNQRLSLQKVLALWKTCCLLLVLKVPKVRTTEVYRLLALTYHIIIPWSEILEQLRPMVKPFLDYYSVFLFLWVHLTPFVWLYWVRSWQQCRWMLPPTCPLLWVT